MVKFDLGTNACYLTKNYHISHIRSLFLAVILTLFIISTGLLWCFRSWNDLQQMKTTSKNSNNNYHQDNQEMKTHLAVNARSNTAIITSTISFAETTTTNRPASQTILVDSTTTYQYPINDSLQNDTAEKAHSLDMIKTKASHEHANQLDPQLRQSFLEKMSAYEKIRQERLSSYMEENTTLLPHQTTGIIIVTNYRSGSTFLGELFNQHPDSFYVFEPLFPYTGGCEQQNQEKVQLLVKLLKCDFPEIRDIYAKVKGDIRNNGQNIQDRNCFLNNFCFRHKVKELCTGKFGASCSVNSWKSCKPISLRHGMNACRKKKITVIKVIRLCDIMNLKFIIAIAAKIKLKVIHLIRDPRGIMSSRLKIHNDLELRSSAEEACARLLHNGQLGLANTSETKWLQDKYLKVRYEDLSLNPIKVAKKVYKFSGLKFLPEIQSWIFNNTKASGSSDPLDPHSTNRNSASVMEAWREHLKFKDVDIVQDVCKNMMIFFGYLPVTSQAELLNFNVTVIR